MGPNLWAFEYESNQEWQRWRVKYLHACQYVTRTSTHAHSFPNYFTNFPTWNFFNFQAQKEKLKSKPNHNNKSPKLEISFDTFLYKISFVSFILNYFSLLVSSNCIIFYFFFCITFLINILLTQGFLIKLFFFFFLIKI